MYKKFHIYINRCYFFFITKLNTSTFLKFVYMHWLSVGGPYDKYDVICGTIISERRLHFSGLCRRSKADIVTKITPAWITHNQTIQRSPSNKIHRSTRSIQRTDWRKVMKRFQELVEVVAIYIPLACSFSFLIVFTLLVFPKLKAFSLVF